MVTPMRAGHVDCEAAQALARYYRNAGIAGLVLFGSTGEGNLLSLPEKIDMIEAIRTDPHALPLVFGAGGVDIRRWTLGWCRRRTTCAPPHPVALQIAWATERPVILYNIPKRAGVAMTVETMETLAALPHSARSRNAILTVVRARARGRMDVLCGEDLAFLDHFQMGGRGAFPPRRTCIPSATSRSCSWRATATPKRRASCSNRCAA